MTWTYTDPGANTRDEIRFLVGDTDTNNQLVTDEEIAYALGVEGVTIMAASVIATAIAAKFARLVDEAVGDLRQNYSQRVVHYRQLANDLANRARKQSAVPFAGGISITAKDDLKDDTDRVTPRFSRGDFENDRNSQDQTIRDET